MAQHTDYQTWVLCVMCGLCVCVAATGTYVMTCGQDKTIKLWNPHRDSVEKPKEALLVKTYEGRHGYDVQDVAMYVVTVSTTAVARGAEVTRTTD